jgi:hypothetical protein
MPEPSDALVSRSSGWIAILGLALAMTLLNALKPLHMDDTIYYDYAIRLAAQPNDPYGGEITDYWVPPKTGMDVLVPVFLPYWWSLAIKVHGDNVFLCKLWLLPFHLLLVGGAWGLARRFARRLEPLVASLIAFSPAILPGINFMLDVPTVSIGTFALYVFTKACDRNSIPLTVVAGLLAGAAINVKWTGFVIPAALGLYAITHRRLALGIVAGLIAAGVFVGWEYWIKCLYGQSHFLTHTDRKNTTIMDRINAARALVALLGGVAPVVLLLGLVGLKRPQFAKIVAVLATLGFVGIALGLGPQAVFLTLGALLLINWCTIIIVLLRRVKTHQWRWNADSLFLALWLMLEIVGFSVLSPYSAVRRLVGIVVVGTLLAARIASLTCRSETSRFDLRWVGMAGVFLGLFYYGVDLHEARVERTSAEIVTKDALGMLKPGQTAWYAGRWGFRHYATKGGLKHIVPGRTEMQRGDLFVVHDNKINMEPKIELDPVLLEEVGVLKFDEDSPVPFRTVPPYYSGKEPIQRQDGPRNVVHIYRVLNPFTPLGMIPIEYAPRGKQLGAMMRGVGGKPTSRP